MHLGGAGLSAGGLLLLLRQRQVDAGELALQRLHLTGGTATQIRSVCAECTRKASESQRLLGACSRTAGMHEHGRQLLELVT